MTTLITLNPIDPGTDTRVTVRLCATQDPADTGADGQVWWPAIIAQPVIQARLFDGDFTSGVDNGSATVEVALAVLMRSGSFPRVERYDWAGATATIQRRNGGTLQTLAVMKVDSFASNAMQLSLRLAANAELFDVDVLAATYAGTGGVEGGADIKGQVKPWVFGRALNVEPVFIDQIDNVFQVSGYGPVQAISAAYERGASFGASIGDFANYAALVAASIPPGRWSTCLAQGLVRFGAPPAGVITLDVDGDNGGGFLRRTGAILTRIAGQRGLSANINSTSLAALDTAVPRNVNIVLADQISFMDLVQRMTAPCNAVPGIAPDGRLIVSRAVFGSEQFTLDAQGRQMPPVLAMTRQNTSAPYKRIQMGAARAWRVHSLDEIAFTADLTERGLYAAGTVYREGDIVASADKSRWLYINPTPSSGNAPPTWPTASDAYWANLEPPLAPEAIGIEPGATEGALIPQPGSGATGNVKDETGAIYEPGELLNVSIELTAAGRLQYRPLPSASPIPLGTLTLPDLGAASSAALRQAEDDIDQTARALAVALDEASRTRQTFTDAGFYADPATGQVRIHAIEQTRERVSTAEIRLNAAEANINLRATVNYVDEAILNAVLDPSQVAELETVFLRLTAAEVDIDGLNATVTTLATATELSLVEGRVTTAESAIDALEGTITTKVDTTTFNALESRVTSAESTLTAIGDTAQIVNSVTAIRLLAKDADSNAENDLRALLQGDRQQRDQVAAIASARQELTARLIDGDAAEASARLALQVRVGAAEATAANETLARISGDNALAAQITALTASTNTSVAALTASILAEQTSRTNDVSALTASITSLNAELDDEVSNRAAAIETVNQARIDGDALIGAGLAQQATAGRVAEGEAAALAEELLGAVLTGDKTRRETNGALAAVRQEFTAQIVSDREAFATSLTALVARLAGAEASVVIESQARATADSAMAASVSTLSTAVAGNTATLTTFGESINGLETRYGVSLDVNGYVTGFVQNNDGETGDFVVLADRFAIVNPGGGDPFTPFEVVGSDVRINGNLIVNGSVTSTQIAANAVTQGNQSYVADTLALTKGAWVNVASVALTTAGGDVRVDFCAAFYADRCEGGSIQYRVRRGSTVLRVGTLVVTPEPQPFTVTIEAGPTTGPATGEGQIAGWIGGTYSLMMVDVAPPAEAHTYHIDILADANSGFSPACESRQMALLEIKR